MPNQSNVIRTNVQTWYGTLSDYIAAKDQNLPIRSGTVVFDASQSPPLFLGISDGAGGFAGLQQQNSLPRWRAKLAAVRAGTGDAIAAIAGDSLFAGAWGSGAIWAGCRPFAQGVLLGNYWAARSGIDVSQDSFFGTGAADAQRLYDSRTSYVNWTGTNDGTIIGLGGNGPRNDAAEIASWVIRFSKTFNSINIRYFTNAGGATFDVFVNGALLSTITPGASIGFATATISCPRTSGGTITVTRRAGAGFFALMGAWATDSTVRRVLMWNWGAGGTTIADWSDQSQTYFLGFQGIANPPDLLYFGTGINTAIANQIGGVAIATAFANAVTNYQAIVDLYRPTTDIVFVTPTPIDLSQASLAQQRAIWTACRQVAMQNGCPIIDNSALFGTYLAARNLGYYLPQNDLIHCGPTGYAAMSGNAVLLPGLLSGY
jgi:hypothetical protein